MDVQLLKDIPCKLGEGPLWHPDESRLYWIDIPAGALHAYDPKRESHDCVYRGDPIGGFTIQHDGSLLLFQTHSRIRTISPNGTILKTGQIDTDTDGRFNDVIADPMGRVFTGTMPTDTCGGRLYRIDCDGTAHVVRKPVRVPNGLGFTEDDQTMYFAESRAHVIHSFEYDASSGDITDNGPLVQLRRMKGIPDGLTVDAVGGIWVAMWDGGCITRFKANGTNTDEVALPVERVTSVTFGGKEYDTLYATTAGGDDRVTEGITAGSIFQIDIDTTGRAEHRSNIDLDRLA